MDPKKIVLAITLVVFTGIVAAQSSSWNLNTVGTPENTLDVTNNSSTTKIVELRDGDGDPITADRLNSDPANLYYRYGPFNETQPMKELEPGYFYGEFDVNVSKGDKVNYNLSYFGDSSYVNISKNQTMNIGNISVEKMRGPEKMKAGDEYLFGFRATDIWNDNVPSDADVNVWFTNGSWTSEKYDLNNYDDDSGDQYWYNSKVEAPPERNGTYVMHARATSSISVDNSFGSTSSIVETYPELDGTVNTLEAEQGCNNQSFFTECSGEAKLSTEYEVYSSNAETVNLSIRKWDSNSSEWVKHEEKMMDNTEGQKYYAEMETPVINTSKYAKKLQLVYNATNQRRTDLIKRNLTYHSFEVEDLSSSKTPPGDYTVRMSVARTFSTEDLERSEIEADIVIKDPEGDEYSSFSLGDMDYSSGSGTYTNRINLPIDAQSGIYSKQINVTDDFGERKIVSAPRTNFNVTNASITFDAPDSINVDIKREDDYAYDMDIQNSHSTPRDLSVEVSGGLSDFTTVNGGNEVSLEGSETEEVPVSFNVSSVQSYEGEITLSDQSSDYSKNIDVELQAPECAYRENDLCLETDGLDVDITRAIEIAQDFTLHYVGPVDNEETYTPVVSGNISDYIEVSPESVTFDSDNHNVEGDLTYDFTSTGHYTGSFEVGEISVDIGSTIEQSSVSDIDQTDKELSFTAPDSLTITSDEKNVMIENTGDREIDSISFSGTPFTVESGTGSLSPGDSRSFTLSFSEVTSGTVTVTATSGQQTTEETISVGAEDPQEQNIEDLRDRISRLDQRVTDQELQSQIDSVSSQINRLSSDYSEQRYQSVVSELNRIERQANQGTQNPQQPNGPQTGGGGGFLPIAIGVFVMMILGFVAYTSVIPEEGDPGYSVLGK